MCRQEGVVARRRNKDGTALCTWYVTAENLPKEVRRSLSDYVFDRNPIVLHILHDVQCSETSELFSVLVVVDGLKREQCRK